MILLCFFCDWLTIKITKTVFPSSTPQKRPKLVIVWLVSQAFIIAFWTFGSVLTNDINMTLYAVLFTYFWICIFSLYKEMNLELYQQSLHYSIQAVWIKYLIMQQMCMCTSMSIELRKELTYKNEHHQMLGEWGGNEKSNLSHAQPQPSWNGYNNSCSIVKLLYIQVYTIYSKSHTNSKDNWIFYMCLKKWEQLKPSNKATRDLIRARHCLTH